MFLAPHHQLITFVGSDALAFLQAQLTNDVSALSVGDWQWQGYCNAKGRLHATFALARLDAQSYGAVVHESVVPFVVKRLSMFRLRSKVAIDVSQAYALMFHLREPNVPAPTIPGTRISLGNTRWIDITSDILAARPPATQADINNWALRGIEARQPEIVAATNEMFVPQMIGFDTLTPKPGVSFSKGCYPGQEIVARAHYRGAVKRELIRVHLPLEMDIAPGKEIVQRDDTAIEIVNCVATPDGWHALAVAPITTGAPASANSFTARVIV